MVIQEGLMRGFPKSINTKRDIENLLELYPEQSRRCLQKMVDNRTTWRTVKKLDATKDGKTSPVQRVIEEGEGDGKKLVQQELVDDPNCILFRLGLTVEAATSIVHDAATKSPK